MLMDHPDVMRRLADVRVQQLRHDGRRPATLPNLVAAVSGGAGPRRPARRNPAAGLTRGLARLAWLLGRPALERGA